MMAQMREKTDYSKTEIFLGNLAIVTWILVGTASIWLFNIFAAIGFFALSAFLVYYELGKKGCLSCFLCKTCTIGMGKLPELFFKRGGTRNVNRKALKLFPFVFVLLSLVPIAFLVLTLLLHGWVLLEGFLFVVLFGYSIYTGFVRQKTLSARKTG